MLKVKIYKFYQFKRVKMMLKEEHSINKLEIYSFIKRFLEIQRNTNKSEIV